MASKVLTQFPPTARYLVGLSGGRDSVALLHLLRSAGYTRLIVCHLDHQLRGRTSSADARFVAGIAAELDCEIGASNVRALAKKSKISIETAARMARFAFFISVARRRRCPTIFLAHQADDLVETALLNLFRGASPGGIAAMRPVSAHRVGKTQLTIVRPLLHVWRRDIDAFVKQRSLKFREDASNAQLHSSRNRIRHRILPYIEKQFGRDVRRAIWRTAQIWSEEDLLLESMIGQINFAEIEVKRLREMHVAVRRRAIRNWLRSQNIADVRFQTIEAVRQLIEPKAMTAKVNLSGARHARRRAGRIFIE